MRALTYVEIDVDYCANTYGSAPCTAAVGVTGTIKCFNGLGTCQDRTNFVNSPVTLRFGVDCGYLPTDIDCIPSLVGVSVNPATLALGTGLGQRATVVAQFRDHLHSDTGPGFDKYLSVRPYDPYKQGTFWGKFRARNPFLFGRKMRVIRGFLGQTLAQMETRTFIIDSFNGPNPSGMYSITAKDVLKLADDTLSQAPALTEAYLSADLTAVATTFTVNPVGAGNAFFPASGSLAVGGKEVMTFTRVGDNFTVVRAQNETTAVAAKQDDRVQLCLLYTGIGPADIIYDLLVNYAGVPSSYINLSDWQLEVTNYLQRVYTAIIAEATGVNTLVSELCEQAAIGLWWDDIGGKIRLQVLREINPQAFQFDYTNILEGTLDIKEQPETRVSEVWTYYGKRNPLVKDEPANFRAVVATVDLQAETDYGSAMLKTIFSRWIPQFGRTIASRLNDIILSRYRDPPRLLTWAVMRGNDGGVVQGGGYNVTAYCVQDATGAVATIPAQVTRISAEDTTVKLEAEEMLFHGVVLDNPTTHNITIDTNANNLNLRTVHDSLFGVPASGVTVNVTINSGTVIGSTSRTSPALDVGTWPVGVTVNVTNNGLVQGYGGDGGRSTPGSNDGESGGLALYTRQAVAWTNTSGKIWGGGGGGAAVPFNPSYYAGGGGGAGTFAGDGGASSGPGGTLPGSVGTQTAGGNGAAVLGVGVTHPTYVGGKGGDPGQAGSVGSGFDSNGPFAVTSGTPGSAGGAIDGVSYLTFTGAGDRRGTEIN